MMKRRKAFALLFVLGVITVVTMLMVALFAGALGPAAQGVTLNRQISGLYVAEAGLQHAVCELESSHAWVAGFNRQLTQGKTGRYTVHFASVPPYTAKDSVNNFAGTGAADSYRGTGTVPKGTALIVVEAEVNGTQQRLEALVGEGLNVPLGTAILGGDTIAMSGQVKVNGIKAFNDTASVAADIHSNRGGSSTDVVTYSGSSAKIEGNVSTVDGNPAALNLGGATITGTTKTGASSRQFPSANILSTIAGKSTSPAPTINPSGPTTLAAGEYYHSGDLVVNGDLNLQGAKLYVSGKVTINGSVEGKGALYSGSTTSLQGSSNINAQESQSIALMSQGDVRLDGFDGNAYLQSLAATDPTFATQWTQAQNTIRDLQNDMVGSPLNLWDHTRMVNYLHVIGPFPGITPTHNGYGADLMSQMVSKLAVQAPSPTNLFMMKRLTSIQHAFKGGGASYGSDRNALNNFYATGDVGALFDATVDEQETATWPIVKNVINSINYDHLGSAYFQGVIYSNGKIVANNELTVLGGVFAKGDIQLNNGVTLTYIQKLFESGGVMSNSGLIQVMSWLGT